MLTELVSLSLKLISNSYFLPLLMPIEKDKPDNNLCRVFRDGTANHCDKKSEALHFFLREK
jgi:hypothetical protein